MVRSVSDFLIQTIQELQRFSCFQHFGLGGGTSLAIRYQHRQSYDIDLFTKQIIDEKMYSTIQKELHHFYGADSIAICISKNPVEHLKSYRIQIHQDGTYSKIDLLQNTPLLDSFQQESEIQMLSLEDIGVLKLMSANQRGSKKDIYDLDTITDKIPLVDLMERLQRMDQIHNIQDYSLLFGCLPKETLLQNPSRLHFIENIKSDYDRGFFEVEEIHAIQGLHWPHAEASWDVKVLSYLYEIGLEKIYAKTIDQLTQRIEERTKKDHGLYL
ncbi:MAG: nucleotidyl transferase AbiEii/AbiGii toxin family protein [Flavobacteriaceae bacterium]|nr:nucleotidyl transferase AbiEii/AbiGii toxin family protein [Flavobacteriaceae bacterium]MCY4217466.1 nucleotidyl transferase AbiEii/AbiGii toxin family protein [Flavobacteriaceae bacterium]MCY4253190.1 nucleotidyl transferase AbiEii/AbiGii toxin family protein [Flavobacteriaceae bacterium]